MFVSGAIYSQFNRAALPTRPPGKSGRVPSVQFQTAKPRRIRSRFSLAHRLPPSRARAHRNFLIAAIMKKCLPCACILKT